MIDLAIIHPDKCCVECEHWEFWAATRGYSEYTPGSDFGMRCEKNHWEWETYGSESQYRDCILAAKQCGDFKERT